jgi:hypothetical protein
MNNNYRQPNSMNHGGGLPPQQAQSMNQPGAPMFQQQQIGQQQQQAAYGQYAPQSQQQYQQQTMQQQPMQQQQQPQQQYQQPMQQQTMQQQQQPQQVVQQNYQQPLQQVPGGQGAAQIQNQQNPTGVAPNAPTANGLQQQNLPNEPQQKTTDVVQEKFKGFLKQAKDNLPTSSKKSSGPNLGFKPTAALAQRHEDALVSGKRPLYQFQVRPYRFNYFGIDQSQSTYHQQRVLISNFLLRDVYSWKDNETSNVENWLYSPVVFIQRPFLNSRSRQSPSDKHLELRRAH